MIKLSKLYAFSDCRHQMQHLTWNMRLVETIDYFYLNGHTCAIILHSPAMVYNIALRY